MSKTLSYYFLTLDIETSTYEIEENGKKVPATTWLSYGYCNLYDKDAYRVATKFYRTWDELRAILNAYQQQFIGYKIFCFVHNLSYEFDFIIKNLSLSSNILSNSTHKVISTTLEEFPQIEFRCTLMISMHSLREIGHEFGFEKLTDDYATIFPHDEIPEEKKRYCCRDCDVTAVYVASLIKEYGVLREIPYTKTGRVRKTFKEFYAEKYSKENPAIWDLMPPENCYQAMLDAFAGGCTLSNPLFTGMVMKEVHSYDITSSYPFAMISELYPYNITRCYDFDKSFVNKPFWIAKIKFTKIRSKYAWQWLSISKMEDFAPFSEFFNGKLVVSNWAIRTITNVDFEMIKLTYNFDDFEILEFYDCGEGIKLPYPYIETIKVCAEKKQILKDKLKTVSKNDKEYMNLQREYMLAKNDFNSIYGMSVQKLMNPEYVIDQFYNWKEKETQYIQNPKKHMKRNFLFGIYITAYARRNLLRAIVENCPYTFVYCDTDSVKFIGENNFVDTNGEIFDELKGFKYLSKLGRFDYEGTYKQFLTFGAKKYAYTDHGDKTVWLTVAGLPKYRGNLKQTIIEFADGKIVHKLNTIKEFKPGIIFRNCKLGKKYITVGSTFDLDDSFEMVNLSPHNDHVINYMKEHDIKTNGGVALYSVDYALDITETDRIFIKENGKGLIKYWASKNLNIIDLTKYCDMKYLID